MRVRFFFFPFVFLTAATAALAQLPQPVRTGPGGMGVASLGDPIPVEDEAVAAEKRIRGQARDLLTKRNYPALDAMAEELRQTAVSYAKGDWAIGFFFSGVVSLPDGTSEADWQAHIQKLRDWFEQDPDCITPRVALARGLTEYAWLARGHGWARTVTDEGWRLFQERITEARRILIAAEELGRRCPVYWSSRLRCALVDGTSREQYEELFEQCIAAFPNYPTYYFVKANYLLPRWHGEEGEWEAFATAAADRLGGEAGDILYARIVWGMHDTRHYGNIFQETKIAWNRTQRGLEAICRHYPNAISAPSEYCYLAGFTPEGGRPLMRSLFAKLDNRVDLSVWKTMARWTSDRQWAFAEN